MAKATEPKSDGSFGASHYEYRVVLLVGAEGAKKLEDALNDGFEIQDRNGALSGEYVVLARRKKQETSE